MESGGSLPHSQEPATCPYPYQRIGPGLRLLCLFRNIIIFYGEELLAPRPTPKLEDRPLSAVYDLLFNVFAATLHNWRPFLDPQPEDAPCHGGRDPLNTAEIMFTVFFYSNPWDYKFLLTQDTQLTLVFQFWTNSFMWSPTFRRWVSVRSAFSELWSVPNLFKLTEHHSIPNRSTQKQHITLYCSHSFAVQFTVDGVSHVRFHSVFC
jgi:hypothetical protein